MAKSLRLGGVNGHAVGIIMKELVRRAIVVVRAERQVFEVTKKQGYSGNMDDVFTTADSKAQDVYVRSLRECFPNAGIVAEEKHLLIHPKGGCNAYFTIDPMDGTKAFVRRQSHGVGSMIALVIDGEIVGAYIGDINTLEIFGFRPRSNKVHRITEFNTSEVLNDHPTVSLDSSYVLLRDPLALYEDVSRDIVNTKFKNHLVDGGSIGTWMARLWKREVGAVILPPSVETPWDMTPVVGICQKLGYKFFRTRGSKFVKWNPKISTEKYRRGGDLLIVHESNVFELFKF